MQRRLALAVLAALALVLPSAPSPAAEPPLPDDFYGTWYDALSRTSAENSPAYDAQTAAGLGALRQYVFWDRIETAPGTYDWRRMDEVVRDVTSRGLTLLPTLMYTPAFYTSKPAGATGSTQYPPKDPQRLADFATAMVERYGPGGRFWCHALRDTALPAQVATLGDQVLCQDDAALRTWEVWNEPDFPAWWKKKPDAREYAQLLTAVSAAIKRADPDAEVVLGALTGKGAAAPGGFLEQLYELGAGPSFDTIAVNPYATSVASMVQRLRDVRAVAVRHGDAAKPIRVLEYGWSTGGVSATTVVTPPCQAALLYAGTVRLAGLAQELGLRSIVQFQWRDAIGAGRAWPDHAGVEEETGRPKASRAALAAAVAGQPAPPDATLAACPVARRAA